MELANVYKLETPTALTKLHFNDIKDKTVSIPDDFPIVKDVTYGMDEWQMKGLLRETYATVNESKTRIEWSLYPLPSVIIDDLKRLALLCLFSSMCSAPGNTKQKAMKPNTVADRIKYLGKFFSKVYEESVILRSGGREVSTIKELSDISYDMLKSVAKDWPEDAKSIIVGLRQIGKYEIRKFLNSNPSDYDWSVKDIDNIQFKKVKDSKASKERWEEKTLPNALFRFVTREAVVDVATAVSALGLELHDKSAVKSIDQELLSKFDEAKAMIDDYVEIRRLDVERSKASKRVVNANGSSVTNKTGVERKAFKKKYKVTVQEFNNWWTMTRTSAQILILQYIGFRHSESLSLKFSHALPGNTQLIRKAGNVWVIRGTVVKHQDNTLPIDRDEWVAIPIVRDAIAVLDALNVILNKSYVFSSSQIRGGSKDRGKTYDREESDKPYAPTSFSLALNQWKKKKDVAGKWSHWKFNVKQFRHSVANQLARAELGLEFITYQMKHMVQALSDMPSDVTLGYGGVGETMQENAIKAAKHEAVRCLYHPESPIAGGMAQEFNESRMTHFKGAMASGMTEEEYFAMLVDQGIPFINVGAGYCSGRKYVQYSDGSKSQPACIGSYECTPSKCTNCVVTESHVPVWVDMFKTNTKNSKDPELFYAHEAFAEKAKDAREVLELLDVDVEALL